MSPVAYHPQADDAGDKLQNVTTSGEGAVVPQILEIALTRSIKVREDADLAEVLAAIGVDSKIPLTTIAAETGIHPYIYRALTGERVDNTSASDG